MLPPPRKTLRMPILKTRRAWPIRLVIAGITVTAMLAVAAALITLSWYGFRAMLLDAAAVAVHDAGQIVTHRTHRMIDPGNALLRTLAADPVTKAIALEDRLARSHALADELLATPLASTILIGYTNGDYLLVRSLSRPEFREVIHAPPQAAYLVQVLTREGGRPMLGDSFFYDAEHQLLRHQSEQKNWLDPRTRPWYTDAIDNTSTIVSGPYVYLGTEQVGITLSTLAKSGQAVVALDVTMEDLAAGLDVIRMTPGTELALIHVSSAVIGYPHLNAGRTFTPRPGGLSLRSIETLGIEPLARLYGIAEQDQPVSYEVGDDEWFGVVLPFDGIKGMKAQLLVAVPMDELLGNLARHRTSMILISLVLILLFFPLGWKVGSAVGKALERLTDQARPMLHFDFQRSQRSSPSSLREVDELTRVMDNTSKAVESFLSISGVLGTEPRIDSMLAQVLAHMIQVMRCRGGAVYLWGPDQKTLERVAAAGEHHTLQNTLHPSVPGVVQGGTASVDDGLWHSTFTLRTRRGELHGLLVLAHDPDWDHASSEFRAFVERLTGMLSVAIETRLLMESQKKLFEATVRILAGAIDAKSPHTGGHCARVPQVATMLADRMHADATGPYADFTMDEDQRYAFHLGAWLHDCGKVTTPEHIIDKATKLELIYNRIHEVRMRFEVLWRDAEIDYLRARLTGEDEPAAAARRDVRQTGLQEDFRFVAQCNIGGEFMSDEDIERLRRIGARTWLRHFDDSLGLSIEESRHLMDSRPDAPCLPAVEPLLGDKLQHIVPWIDAHKPAVERDDPRNQLGFDMELPEHQQNTGELYNLSVRRGTLTSEDRFMINNHIVQTLVMLKEMPWPPHLERVPDIAANHHEKMDGTGYPRRLGADELHITDRVMALADVFEALTARDRPYRPTKTLSESLRIMAFMSRDRHLDGELYLYFLRSRVWLDYGRTYLHPEQIDEVDVEALADLVQPELEFA